MGLPRRQVIRDDVVVNEQTKHSPGVAWRLKLDHNPSKNRLTPNGLSGS